MKKQIRLNEAQLRNVVKKIVKESLIDWDELGTNKTNLEDFEDDISYDEAMENQKQTNNSNNNKDPYTRLKELCEPIVAHLSEDEQIFLLEQVNNKPWDVIYALIGALNNRY